MTKEIQPCARKGTLRCDLFNVLFNLVNRIVSISAWICYFVGVLGGWKKPSAKMPEIYQGNETRSRISSKGTLI